MLHTCESVAGRSKRRLFIISAVVLVFLSLWVYITFNASPSKIQQPLISSVPMENKLDDSLTEKFEENDSPLAKVDGNYSTTGGEKSNVEFAKVVETEEDSPKAKINYRPSIPTKRYSTYRSFIPNSALSKDLTIHRVYYDDRQKVKGHHDQIVFFIDANWTMFKHDWIIGCGVNDVKAADFKIRIPAEWYWVRGSRRKVPFKYEHLYVDCYDMPVKPGDRPFLLYKTSNNSDTIVVESDYPIILPDPKTPSTDPNYNITIVTCIKANTKGAPFLGEILHYQTSVGVDHVSLLTLSSFIKDGGLKKLLTEHPYIIKLLTSGFISVDMWKVWHDETQKPQAEIRLWTESIRKVGCSYHYQGTYDYAQPIDSDDFFTPRVVNQTNIKYYLKKYCSGDIGSCMLRWVFYYPQYCGLNKIPTDGNVTKALKSFSNHSPSHAKSIHRTKILLDASFHDAKNHGPNPGLMPGYKIIRVPTTECDISHLRLGSKPKNGRCK